ncbi:MAG: peptidylprolyl isomerase [Pseudomonadota bacterium]|nr:peptidylprolyl isomerase [Pseudomonadota bacterium]
MTSIAKKLFYSLSATLLLMISTNSAAAEQLLDRVAAIVNDQVILQSELEIKTRETAMGLRAKNIPVADLRALQTKVLDSMILEMLQKERAQQLGLSISDEEVNEQLAQIAKKNNLTLLELRNRLNAERPNAFIEVRQDIEQQLLIQKLRQKEVISRTLVTGEEIKNYLQRSRLDTSNTKTRLRHILITLPESATAKQREEAQQQIENIASRIKSGESFQQLAVRYSKGSKALQGGDLGWLKQEQIPTFFSEAIQDLEIGQVSPVISSPSGFHLIKLEGRKDDNSQLVKQYKLHRFIILSSDASNQSEVPPAILEIVNNTQDVETFKGLNARFSDIPKSVNATGDFGWMSTKELPEDLIANLDSTGKNRVASPIGTDQGWVLFYLEDVRDFDASQADAEKKAIQEIRMRKANETFEIWLRRLKDEAFIDIRL